MAKRRGWKVKKTVLKSVLFTVCFYLSALIAVLLDWNTNVLLCAIFCLAAMVYAYLAEAAVKPGDNVLRGQKIGLSETSFYFELQYLV